jgi:hypothetical protein
MSRFEFESGTFPWFCYITFVHMENRVCLSRGVQVAGATWWAAMRIVAGVGDLVQRIRDDQAQVRYSVAGQSGGRVTPCAIYTVHIETRRAGFLVEPQNQCWQVFCLGLKTDSSGLVILASKSPRQFLCLGLKIKRDLVCWLYHKTDEWRSA